MDWIKSPFCAADRPQCVEVRVERSGEVLVRDSKAGDDSPVLRFTADEWDAFKSGVKAGEFDIAREGALV